MFALTGVALLCLPLANCSKKVTVVHYVAPAADVRPVQRHMQVVYSDQYHERVVEYQNDSGAWFVAGMLAANGIWTPLNYPYTYWNPGYYNGWASQNNTTITYNNYGNTSAGTTVATGTDDVDATSSGDPQSVVGTAPPSADDSSDYTSDGTVDVAPSSSSDDSSADGTPAETNSSSSDNNDGAPAASSSSSSDDNDGAPAASSSSSSDNNDGAPAASSSSSSDDNDGAPAASSSSSSDDDSSMSSGSSGGDDSSGDSSDSGGGDDE